MKKLFTIPLLVLAFSTTAQDSLTALAFAPSGYPIPLRKKPDVNSKQVGSLEGVDSVILLSYDGGNYFYVAPKKKPKEAAYLHIDFLRYDKEAVEKVNHISKEKGGIGNLEHAKLPKDYASRAKSYPKSNYSHSSTSPSRTIHTGPRGGKYYINKNGKKTYVKH